MFATLGGIQRHSDAAADAQNANGWTLTPIVQASSTGPGFRTLYDGAVNINGAVAVRGNHSSMGEGVFAIDAGQVISIALVGSALPGSLGTVQELRFANSLAVDATGAVWFEAKTSVLPVFSVYRWTQGAVSLVLAGDAHKHHLLNTLQPNGTWIADEFDNPQFAGQTFFIASTSGYQLVFSARTGTINPATCRTEGYGFPHLSANGTLIVVHSVTEKGAACAPPTVSTYSVLARGTVSKTVTSTMFVSTSGNKTQIFSPVINESGTIAMWQRVFQNGVESNNIVITNGSQDTTVFSSSAADFVVHDLRHIDHAGRVAFDGELKAPSQASAILAGPSLTADRVVTGGDLIGTLLSPKFGMRIVDVASPPTGLSDQRVILFKYSLDANHGFAIATRAFTRWVNAAGGAWTTPTNWSSGSQPDPAGETLFDLEASYLVNLDAFEAGRMRVENGTVGLRGASMRLSGPLEVGGDATLALPEGTLSASEISVGALAPTDPAKAVTAKIAVSGAGTVLSTTGITRVGTAGDGELRVNGAVLVMGDTRIGAGAAGTITVEQPNSSWASGALTIGEGHAATLHFRNTAIAFTTGSVVIGAGATPNGSPATVRVSSQSDWHISGTVVLGERMPATLSIEDTGAVDVINNDLKTGSVNAANNGVKATLNVSGSLHIGRDLQLGLADPKVAMNVVRGGRVDVDRNMSIGQAPDSNVTVVVSGIGPQSVSSKIEVGDPALANSGECLVGVEGSATLRLHDGGTLKCRGGLTIGVLAGGEGTVVLRGDNRNGLLTHVDAKQVCIGASVGCGTEGSSGQLWLIADSKLSAETGVVIGRNGALHGNGIIAAGPEGVSVEDGGAISPDISKEPPLEPLEPLRQARTARASAVQPGTLTISGNLTLRAGALMTINITSSADFDKIIVTGNSALNGTLVLNFSNGYAPKQGDSFTFLTSPNSSGAFATVEIAGLAPGFQYAVTSNGGATQLVANNNGVATTQQQARRVLLPLVRR